MRLLQSVLPTLRQTKKPQQKFVAHRLRLRLMLPGHATFRHLSRYSAYHERTFARWYARDCDVVSLNKAAITQVMPPEHEQALVLDASCVPKSGQKTYGLDRFWNGSHSRTETGVEISTLAWLDMTENCAYGLSVEQTPPTDQTTDSEATRMAIDRDQLAPVVSEHQLSHRRDVVTDGYYRTQKFTGGVRDLGLEQIGNLRLDAHRRDLYQGPKRPGPGRPKTSDGKVHWDDLARFEHVETDDDDIVLSHQVLHHVPYQCNLRVVLVVDTKHHRRAVLLSTDVDLDALTIYRYDKARFHIECLCRDAKQLTGLTDSQARSPAKRNFHFNASLSAVTLAKLDARQPNGDAASVFSMASLKRRAFNQHLIERMSQHVAQGHSLEKSSPAYEELCNYGTITGLAA
jgi:DDE superfamily endonuclease